MSLRTRIALATAVSVATIAVVLGAIGYLGTRSRLLSEIRQELSDRAAPYLTSHGDDDHDGDDAGANGRAADHPGGGAQMCAAPGEMPMHPALGGATGYFQSVCPGGRVVANDGGTPKLPVTARVRAIARAAAGHAYFAATVERTRVEILAIGDRPDRKAIEVALPLTATDRTLDGLLVTYLILVGVGVVLAGILGLVIGRAAVAPIVRFAAHSEQATSSLAHPGRLEQGGTQELRRLATSFNLTLDALEASVEAQRQLIADASHELRTPMAALRSNIQVFLDSAGLPEAERRDLEAAIVAELDELTQLVSDVLELARGARSDDHVEPIELDLIVRDAVDRARRRAPEMAFAVSLSPAIIDGQPDLIARAIGNLIDNARKWSPAGGEIEVTLAGAQLTVRDHGPGIPERDLAHVFDRFYRSDQARRLPGSGLGLAIVKQAADAHGGEVTAANASDGGAVFTIRFGAIAQAHPRASSRAAP